MIQDPTQDIPQSPPGPGPARDEAARIEALAALGILGTAPEPHFEAVCRIARRVFGVAGAFVAMMGDEQVWLKTPCELIPTTAPRRQTFCHFTVERGTTIVARDTREHPDFRDLAAVRGEGAVRFYAGIPLALEKGLPVGTFCLVDTVPRDFTDEHAATFADLAETVIAHLRLAHANAERTKAAAVVQAREAVIFKQNDEIELRARAQESADAQLMMAEWLASIGTWQVTLADGRVTWSPGLFRISGLDPQQPPPNLAQLAAYYHPDDRERVQAAVAAAVASGDSFAYEARILRPDASTRDVVVRGVCQHDADGTAIGLVGVLIDVTEMRRVQDAVRRSDVRYRGLAESLPLLVWTMRVSDGEATYLNAQFRAYYGPIGAARAERLARNHPDDSAAMQKAWERALATGQGYSGQWRIRRHDGVYRWHQISVSPILLDARGDILEWFGTALDVDDIVTARIAVEDARQLLGLALEAAGAGTWDWDMQTGLVSLAPESARMHGLECGPGETCLLSAAEWTALLNPDDAADAWNEVRRAIDSRTTYAAQFRAGDRWIYARGRTVFGDAERPVRMVGLHLDITDSKATEAALRAATHDAETARAEAERASAAKSNFLAAMSHEIRTPLNGILGYADLLLEGDTLVGEDRRRLSLIQNSGTALLTVVNDVLDFSKIEAGELALEAVAFPLVSLIEAAISIVRGGALKSGLAIRVDLDPDLPRFVVGDSSRLQQVLLNLLNNAVKFTTVGSVTLSVRRRGGGLAPEGRPGEALHFAVTDTGIGIAPADQARLFRRFSQVDGSISRRFGGTGLGLAISHQLVTLMGGEIGVDSREGEGSTFWFTLTLPRGEQPALSPAQPRRDMPGTVAAITGGAVPEKTRTLRLLLAEDVAINRELACAVLESQGYEVAVAVDGGEAFAAVEAAFAMGLDFDLVLMDVQMPGVDGLAATRRIRTLAPPACDVPIVAMTANVLPEQIEELLQAGMDDHVGKPFRRNDLCAMIERWTAPGARKRLARPEPVVPPDPAIDPQALDAEVLDAMRLRFGPDRVDGLLDMLAGELSQRFRLAMNDRQEIAHDAHAMVSAAGMLGFAGLSELCRELEAAAHAGGDLSQLIRRLEVQRAKTLRIIRTIRAA
ncbi:PAS domain-containing protein [Methylobacterium sp. J-076]|uniref:PAS domain-containing protein n=1 Tax=Methylobacterium sp. J-076 TaxID=2836655 RepID=UPI001FB8CEE4|nr:PAS domain-containing protein [Methylobacterium sp. J-076]MCJ2014647.1 PAS domain-containing protein [Methylobacterium sp. J-076]